MTDLLAYPMYEGSFLVTQLGATSEVASIGIKLLVPEGERIAILHSRFLVDDIAAGKSLSVNRYDNNDNITELITSGGLDATGTTLKAAVIQDSATPTVNARGVGMMPLILGSGQYIEARITDTLDAGKKFYWYITYLSLGVPATFSVLGAGITLTTEKHEAI